MTPQNQQRILRAYSQFADEVCEALKLGPYSHEKGIDALRTYGQKTASELLLALIKNTMPNMAADMTLMPEHFPQVLDAIDTREKAEALLLQMPDETADKAALVLKELRSLLFGLRGLMQKTAKQLPHDPGGRHKKLRLPEDLRRIRRNVGVLVGRGWPLPKAKKKVAKDEKVSMSTFGRRWRESEAADKETDLE